MAEDLHTGNSQNDLTVTQATTESAWEAAAVERLKATTTAPPVPRRPLPHQLTDRYTLEERLGEGSFGTVFRATDSTLNRQVAIKTIKAVVSDINAAEFRTEAETAARVEHSNVVRIYDWHTSAEDTFLVMELVEGRSLRQWRLGRDEVSVAEAVQLVQSAVCGLEAAHGAGLIHRDIKSANILVSDKDATVRLTDFGLALPQDADSSGVAGSLRYMSPEHLDPTKDVDHRSDVYSMGVVLFEMLTGSRPFEGTTAAISQQILFRQPPSATERNDQVNRDLATITDKCLRKDPGDRYASAAALRQDLEAWQQGRPIAARPVGRLERLYRWARREPIVASLSSLLIVGVIVAGVLGGLSVAEIIRQRDRAESSAEFAHTQTDHFLDVIDLLVTNITDKLSEVPGAADLRQDVLQTAIVQLVKASDDLQQVPEASRRLSTAHVKLARIFRSVGETERAREQLRSAIHVAEQLVAEAPDAQNAREQLVVAHVETAEFLLHVMQDTTAARPHYIAAAHLSEKCTGPLAASSRFIAMTGLGILDMFTDNIPAAIENFEQAVQFAVDTDQGASVEPGEIAMTLELLGECYAMNSQLDLSIEALESAIGRRKAAWQNQEPESENLYITNLLSLGRAQAVAMRPAAALEVLFQSQKLAQQRSERFPENVEHSIGEAAGCDAIGIAYMGAGMCRKAIGWFQNSIDITERLLTEKPEDRRHIKNLVNGLYHRGQAQFALLDPVAAELSFRKANQLLERLGDDHTGLGWTADIPVQLMNAQYCSELTVNDISAEVLMTALPVVGSKLRILAENGTYDQLRDFHTAIDAAAESLEPIYLYNVASVYVSTLDALQTRTASPDQQDDWQALCEHARERALLLFEQLHEQQCFDGNEALSVCLHHDDSLHILNDNPRFRRIRSGVRDPLDSVSLLPVELPQD